MKPLHPVYFQEGRLLNAAHRLQQATDYHLHQPAGLSQQPGEGI